MIEKDPKNIKFPATHLNSMFVSINNSVKSNKPKYVRHKRRNSSYVQKESDLSSSSSSEISEDEPVPKKSTEKLGTPVCNKIDSPIKGITKNTDQSIGNSITFRRSLRNQAHKTTISAEPKKTFCADKNTMNL